MGSFNRDRGSFGGRREGGFNRGGRGGGSFGGRGRDSGSRGSFGADRSMHKAVCAECGDECQVPFKPTGDRPVLCSSCFKGPGNNEPRRDERRSFDRPRFEDKEMFSATCAECGDDCQVPFKPHPGKEVLCSDCFGNSGKGEKKSFDNQPAPRGAGYDKQFEALNVKLNKILELLNPSAKAEVKKAVKEIFEEKSVPAVEEVAVKEVVEEKKDSKKVAKKVAKKEVKKEDKKDKKPAAKKVAKKK